MDIKEALAKLDPTNAEHWTGDGAPKLDALKDLMGETVSRQQVIEAAPQFTRDNAVIEPEDPFADPDPEQDEDEVVEASDKLREYLDGEVLGPIEMQRFLENIDDDDLNFLEQLVASQLEAANVQLRAAEELQKLLKYDLGLTRATIKARIPDVDNQTAIRQYINAQNKARSARVENAKEAKRILGGKNIDPLMAIDRSMARKTARGGKRPQRPKMKG